MPCNMISVGLLASPACRYLVRNGPAWMNPWLNSTPCRSDQTLVYGRDGAEVSVTTHSNVGICALFAHCYAISEPHRANSVKTLAPADVPGTCVSEPGRPCSQAVLR